MQKTIDITMTPAQVIDELGYRDKSANWVTVEHTDELTAQLWRSATEFKVHGTYVFQTSTDNELLPPRPAVHVVEASTTSEAREVRDRFAKEIHRKFWNLGTAPFLIIILPGQVRVYSGFNYNPKQRNAGIIAAADLKPQDIRSALSEFYASEIDSGRIWQTQSHHITPNNRVDQHLLRNLRELGRELVKRGLTQRVAHALIGKYIYIRYLTDREILTDEWLQLKDYGLVIEDVLGDKASAKHLQKLINILETRFNGKIFPLNLVGAGAPSDEIIHYIASVFRGTDAVTGQLTLDFRVYDFSYVPVETLSSIYEQFLHAEGKGKDEGAVYTREFVADYLLCELNSFKPLKRGMKVLDPACGSGVFLVLAYRRLIEQELQKSKSRELAPEDLRAILEESIYGIEPIADACYVAEFSLILTLLSYIKPPELQANEDFRFPELHNKHIFECDFFDSESMFWKKLLSENMAFDWIAGNPPWTKLESSTAPQKQRNAWEWLNEKKNKKEKPVGQYSLSEAFTWRVVDVLDEDGCVGLLIHGTSLFNTYSKKYRQAFFTSHNVKRITNFANLAYVLFAGSADVPAATIIYTRRRPNEEKAPIIHYGPFAINQVFNRTGLANDRKKRSWTIILYENEVQTVDHQEAEKGDATTWKLALWGTYLDQRALNSFRNLFPKTLKEVIEERNWKFRQGLEVCKAGTSGSKYLKELSELKCLNTNFMSGGFYLSVPSGALETLDTDEHYYRDRNGRAGKAGLEVILAPHLFWSPTFAAFSDLHFVLRAPQVGLAAPEKDTDYLRAVSAYLNSSVGRYLLFFQCASWGVDRNKFATTEAEGIPLPEFSIEQVGQLAKLHRALSLSQINSLKTSSTEPMLFSESDAAPAHSDKVRAEADIISELDTEIERILNIPDYLGMIAREFIAIRYPLNKGGTTGTPAQLATEEDLLFYAKWLTQELDAFSEVHHKVQVERHVDCVVCLVEITSATDPIAPVVIEAGARSSESFHQMWDSLQQQFSQWVYVQRGLRLFEGNKIRIIKSPRLLDWSQTQALLDSDDIIAEVLSYESVIA